MVEINIKNIVDNKMTLAITLSAFVCAYNTVTLAFGLFQFYLCHQPFNLRTTLEILLVYIYIYI